MKEENNQRAELIVEAAPGSLNTSDLLQTATLYSVIIIGISKKQTKMSHWSSMSESNCSTLNLFS